MKLRALAAKLLFLVLAGSTAAAWDLHVLGAHHEAGDDCQVCAVAAAPELNADCGTDLLAQPADFVLLQPGAAEQKAELFFIPAFQGRAPPAV